MFLAIPLTCLAELKAIWQTQMAGTMGAGKEMTDGQRNLVVFEVQDITLDEITTMLREIDSLEVYQNRLPPEFTVIRKEKPCLENSFQLSSERLYAGS